jgi:tetratricopeptide (TPR) repeat protein
MDDAIPIIRTALAKHQNNGALHSNLGIALASKGDQDAAQKEFEESIKRSPNDPMFHLVFAQWLNNWKVRGAAFHLDTARQNIKPDDLGMLASIGHEYRMAGSFPECVQVFDKAVSLKDGGEVRTERALCRLGQKDETGTLGDLQAAVKVEPSYAPAHYYLGGRLAIAKKFKDAAAEYDKYLQLAPTGSLAQAASERLKAAQEAAGGAKGGAAPKGGTTAKGGAHKK